jgi:hypothetical protein
LSVSPDELICLKGTADMKKQMRVVSVVALSLVAGLAIAQPEGQRREGRDFGRMSEGARRMGMGGNGQEAPAFNRRQIERMAERMELTEDQKVAAMTLLEGYEEQVRKAQEDARTRRREAMEKFRESQDPAVWDTVRDSATADRDARKKLDTQLLTDLSAVMTAEQAAKWPSAERALKRGQSLRRGLLSAERADIMELVQESELPEQTLKELEPVLSQYELDIERQLAERDRLMEAAGMDQMFRMRMSGDNEGLEKFLAERRDAATKVRDINKRYARQIQDALPEDAKPAFAQRFKEESYPDIYRRTQGHRAIDAAWSMSDLSDEQKLKIDDIRNTFTGAADKANATLQTHRDRMEADLTPARLAQEGMRALEDEDMRSAMRARRELDQGVLAQLKDVLTPEQFEKLPKPDNDEPGERRQRRGRGEGGGGDI